MYQHGVRRFSIRVVSVNLVQEVQNFYSDVGDEHLWPRSREELLALARDGALFCCQEVMEDAVPPESRTHIVGACYVKAGDADAELDISAYEFGGVCVSDNVRGLGVGTFVSTVAIATVVAQTHMRERTLIAHVHELNPLPRGLLRRLGFAPTGKQVSAPDAPTSMRRNPDGMVIGDEFRFEQHAFAVIADVVEEFDGRLDGKGGNSVASVEINQWNEHRSDIAEALRALALMGDERGVQS